MAKEGVVNNNMVMKKTTSGKERKRWGGTAGVGVGGGGGGLQRTNFSNWPAEGRGGVLNRFLF